jgi:hypothetical protein
MADMKFEFVVENMTREQANVLGSNIIDTVELLGLVCGGNVHGMELKEELNYLELLSIAVEALKENNSEDGALAYIMQKLEEAEDDND